MATFTVRMSAVLFLLLMSIVGIHAQQEITVHPASIQKKPLPPEVIAKMPVIKLPVRAFKLLSPTTGWASTTNKLLLSIDAGRSWKDISPPGQDRTFTDVLFLDAMTGWVLYSSDSDGANFIVATTINGGENWTTSNVKISLPPPEDGGPELGGQGQLAFSDHLNGYLFFNYQTGSAFSSSGLYATADGGATWHDSHLNPGFFGTIRAFSNGQVWAVDGNGRELAVSRGSSGFNDVSLPTPPSVAPAAGPRYSLPVFADSDHGYLAVTYKGGPGPSSAAALFETTNAGRSWASDRTLLHLRSGETIPTVVVDSTWTLPFALNASNHPTVVKIRSNDHIVAPPHEHSGAFHHCELSVVSSQGWANCGGELSSTTDGGASWVSISPRARNGVITQNIQ